MRLGATARRQRRRVPPACRVLTTKQVPASRVSPAPLAFSALRRVWISRGQSHANRCVYCLVVNISALTTLRPLLMQGYFSTGGATTCTQCTAGSYCPYSSTNTEVPCGTGFYSAAGATRCTPCPAGYACTTATTVTPTTCSSGYYSVGGASACVQCPAGSFCAVTPPSSGSAVLPVACQPGYYSLIGALVCTQCPAGTWQLGVRATSCSRCIPRTPHHCSAGSTCPSTSAAPTQCAAGTWSAAGSFTGTCSLASPGYLVPAGSTQPQTVPSAVAAGTWFNPMFSLSSQV